MRLYDMAKVALVGMLVVFLNSCGGGSSPRGGEDGNTTMRIMEILSYIEGVKREGELVPGGTSKVTMIGLNDTDVKIKIATNRGSRIITPSKVSTKDNTVTFTSPFNVLDGDLSVVKGDSVLDTAPYHVYLEHAPRIIGVTPQIAHPGDMITIRGKHLLDPLKVMSDDGNINLPVSLSGQQVSFSLPVDASSGNLYLHTDQGDTNRLYLTVRRNVDASIALADGLDIKASEIELALGGKIYIPDNNLRTTVSMDNKMQYLHTAVRSQGNTLYLYGAVVLPGTMEPIIFNAKSTAVCWVLMALGSSAVTPNEQLRSLHNAVFANAKVEEFARYIETLQKEDYDKWATQNDSVLESKFQNALKSVIDSYQASHLKKLSKVTSDMSSVSISQLPKNDNIYIENRKNDGNVWIVNDTRLFLSVEISSNKESNKGNIINGYQHPEDLIDMQFVDGIVSPKGWPLLGLSNEKKIYLGGEDAKAQIIIGSGRGETEQKGVNSILKARTFIDGYATPILSTLISTLLDKSIDKAHAYRNIIEGLSDIYGENFLKQLVTDVSKENFEPYALVDTFILMPVKKGITGCLKTPSGTVCTKTMRGLAKIAGLGYSEDIIKELLKALAEQAGEQVAKNVLVAIPVWGWITRGALFVYDNYGEIANGITVGETVYDITANPKEINVDIDFKLRIEKVSPMCLVVTPALSPVEIHIQGEGFVDTASGTKATDIFMMDDALHRTEITRYDMLTDAGLYARFDAGELIKDGSTEENLFVGYRDGLYVMYDTVHRVVDQNDETVYLDSIKPESAAKGASVVLKGCGWIPLKDVKVFFSKEDSPDYVEAEILMKTPDSIKVKVPPSAKSGTVYVTAGDKVTKKILFDVNPFSLNEPYDDEVKLAKKDLFSWSGYMLNKAEKIYFTDYRNVKREGTINQQDENRIEVTVPDGLAYGPVRIYAEDSDGIETNEITLPYVPLGVDANPSSKSFEDSITVTLTQEDNVDIYYRIDDGEEQKYESPITLKEEEAVYVYYSLHVWARVEVGGVKYESNELVYKYRPEGSPMDINLTGEEACTPEVVERSCPIPYDINISNGYGTIIINIRDKDGDGVFEDRLKCDYASIGRDFMTNTIIVDNEPTIIEWYYPNSRIISSKTLILAGHVPDAQSYACYSTGELFREFAWRSYFYGDGYLESHHGNHPGTHIWKEYYRSGVVAQEVPFVDGEKHGEEIQKYESGVIRMTRPWSRGKQHGTEKQYYDSSEPVKLSKEINYKNGILHGIEKWYTETGDIVRDRSFVDGEERGAGVWNSYYGSGRLRSERHYYDGKLHGQSKGYSSAGLMTSCDVYSHGVKTGSCMP